MSTPILSSTEWAEKLRTLRESEGYDSSNAFFEAIVGDSVSSAICVNEGCEYTTEIEPDQERGYCEVCGTNTVQSALILAGWI